jgi:hypothetical protein
MAGLRFADLIARSVHECAPDHATHTIEVGELRRAVEEMSALRGALYEALDELSKASGLGGNIAFGVTKTARIINRGVRALTKAAGDAP